MRKGQTLTEIAKLYGIDLQRLIKVNHLDNPNNLNVGAKLSLSNQQIKGKTIAVNANASSNNTKVTSKLKAKSIRKANRLTNKARLAKWRKYGPLQIDWSQWQSMGGSYVVPSINSQGQALYLAVNCSAKKLNATGANGAWKKWSSPQKSFEHNLLKDLCQSMES